MGVLDVNASVDEADKLVVPADFDELSRDAHSRTKPTIA